MTDAAAGGADTSEKKAGESKGAQYHCDYCRKDITNVIRIRCAQCTDFDLCLECFSIGAHVFPHEPTHDYRVVSNVKTPLYTEDWGADEELTLLEALEMVGMGNWSDVADHVGTKNKTQCEQHYDEVYLHSATAPLPDPAKALTRRYTKQEDTEMKDANAPVVKEEGAATAATGAAGSTKVKPPARAHAVTKPKPKSGLGHLVGFIPNRGDFDTEWENDAELTLADMEFKDEDTKWERDLKLKVLEIYNSKLDARIERKKFILERGLLERKEKKRSKEEREVYNSMRVFARFHSAEEHEAFIQGLLNEQRLRKKIEQLQTYRLNGIRTLADGELFEIERKKREQAGGRKGGNATVGATVSSATAAFNAGASSSSAVDAKGKKRTADAALTDDSTGKKVKTEGGKTVAAPNSDWDVTKMPGHELLSAQERLLCSTLQLLPQHYLMIKERLIRECFTRGFLKENQAKQLIKIDVNKTSKIFDFFVSVGWLNTTELIHANAKNALGAAGAPSAPSGASGVPGSGSSSSSAAIKKPAPPTSSAAASSSNAPRPTPYKS